MEEHETLVPYIKELASFESLNSTSKPPTCNMYWQTYPQLLPTTVFALICQRGQPLRLPLALDEPSGCEFCGYYLCSQHCPGQQNRHRQAHTWRPGPSQNEQQIGFRQAGTLLPYHTVHESRTISGGGYTGLHPGMAWIGANYNTGGGQV